MRSLAGDIGMATVIMPSARGGPHVGGVGELRNSFFLLFIGHWTEIAQSGMEVLTRFPQSPGKWEECG